MNLNALLIGKNIDPREVLVMRHRPYEPELRRVLPWLAAEKPDVFNAYQQTQGKKVEKAMLAAKQVASFIGHEPGKALFIGLYSIGKSRPLTYKQYWKVPAYIEMKAFGMTGFTGESRVSVLWFELALMDFYAPWKGKLVIGRPPPERSWWRRAHRNEIPVHAILEDSYMPFSKTVRSTLPFPHGTRSISAGMNSASCRSAGARHPRNGAESTTSMIPLPERDMSVSRMAETICLAGGETMLHPDTEGTVCFASAIRKTFDLRSCSGCHRTWTPMMLSGLKGHGRKGCIRAHPSV
jgi:hypothetical protein